MTDHYMPPGEPRCSAAGCRVRSQCVRALANHERGRPLQDYTQSGPWSPSWCGGFVRVGFWQRPVQAGQPRRVHETPEGLR